jgi:hypothetical protein
VVAWRETASQQALHDIDALCGTAGPRAQREIEATGGFNPFGFVVDPDGELVAISVGEEGEPVDGDEDLDHLWRFLTENRNKWRAIAVAFQIRMLKPDSDAIRVDLEHHDGTCIAIVVPFAPRLRGSGYRYDGMQVAIGEPRVWADA